MKKFNLYLCLLDLEESRDILLEKYDEMSVSIFIESFENDLVENEVKLVSLENGLKELDDYFEYEERKDDEIEEYENKKKEFVSKIEHMEGKFYMWSVEYSLELMFIED
jgi:hypothetical protein